MSYEIDRIPTVEPSLREMSEKAIRILEAQTANSDRGSFLMIEGSRIGTHVHEILAYNEVIDFVSSYVDDHPGTVLISVSDHETGGLSLALQTNSSSYPKYPYTVLLNGLGIYDFTDEEIDFLIANHTKQEYEYYMANLTSWRAQIGWATHGHSAVDVNLYAHGIKTRALRGNHKVIYIDHV
ncbi:5391_t:CDS:2, partial [Scutellospora calospora]